MPYATTFHELSIYTLYMCCFEDEQSVLFKGYNIFYYFIALSWNHLDYDSNKIK